jgi:glucose-1-phosphate cytidylyltransferase
MREHSETIPKPLVPIGYRPVIWHLMRYYAHYGHKDFVLCLGYRGDMIREYFLDYREQMSNDFVLSDGGRRVELLSSDIQDWRITFVDTGLHANLGERLLRVRKHVEGESVFLANYSDGLTDLPLDQYVSEFQRTGATASFAAVRVPQSFHSVRADASGMVESIMPVSTADFRINGGFFCFRPAIFEVLRPGEELVEEPFRRLIERRKLWSYRYEGFWAAVDTFKDKIMLDRVEARGDSPWMVWRKP